MKSFNKKRLTACLGIAMGMSAMATSVQAIEVAVDNVGRILMAPIYVADNNQSTKIAITNPDNDRAVKARIGFRSAEYSDEFFDFIIYLSPGDVFRGEIYGSNGVVMFKSSDDSVRKLPGTSDQVIFSDVEATDFAVPVANIREGDNAKAGHFEVVSVYSAEDTVVTPQGNVEIVRGMSKVELAKVFDTDLSILLPLNGCSITGATEDCATLKASDVNSAEIYGEADIKVSGARTIYPLTAITYSDENGNGIADCDLATSWGGTGYCEKAQGNPGFDFVVGSPYLLGTSMLPNSGDNIVNIERALATSSAQGIYDTENDTKTSIMVTFPTRYRHENNDVCRMVGNESPTMGYSGPFRDDRSVSYYVSQFNNKEQLVPGCTPRTIRTTNLISGDQDEVVESICPPSVIFREVEIIPYDWSTAMDGVTPVPDGFTSGKYHLELIATNGLSPDIDGGEGNTCASLYRGVPAIVKTMKQTRDGGIIGVLNNYQSQRALRDIIGN